MVDYQVPEDAFINSIIGEGTRLSGEFDLNGLLRIDGDFCGTVRTKGKVLVGRNGRAECTVHAGTVVIGGVVRGNIFASERVVILSTGVVLGNIQAPRFIVEEGVVLHGTCKVEHGSGDKAGAATAGGAEEASRPAGGGPQGHGPDSRGADGRQPSPGPSPQPVLPFGRR